jgi:hypothetical protein
MTLDEYEHFKAIKFSLCVFTSKQQDCLYTSAYQMPGLGKKTLDTISGRFALAMKAKRSAVRFDKDIRSNGQPRVGTPSSSLNISYTQAARVNMNAGMLVCIVIKRMSNEALFAEFKAYWNLNLSNN